jgi:uncharacterized C2H2 Zn-finger protein
VAAVSGQVRGKVFQCDDCDAWFVEVNDIIKHVYAAHGRHLATRAERTPTDPPAVESVA